MNLGTEDSFQYFLTTEVCFIINRQLFLQHSIKQQMDNDTRNNAYDPINVVVCRSW